MALSLVLFDSCKKYFVIQDELPMRKNGTPGSDADMNTFYEKWLPLVAKEFYRMNGVKKSDQVVKRIITEVNLDKNLVSFF